MPTSASNKPDLAASSMTGDVSLDDALGDAVSAVSFSPAADILAATSWDGGVRLYVIGQQNNQKAIYNHEGPALDVCWSSDGSKVISGGSDCCARLLDVSTGVCSQVASHQASVKNVRWIDMHGGLLLTGSWDKTLRYWDLRTPNPVATVNLPEKCYALDVRGQLLVVAMAERHIQSYNLSNPTVQYGPTIYSPLKFQTRSIACFPEQDGYALGSIEGRVAIQYLEDKRAKSENFSFKCHRANDRSSISTANQSKQSLFAVNSIAFHPIYGTFATAGSDGTISFWDKDNKTRLKSLDVKAGDHGAEVASPVVAMDFSNINGSTILAYALSYDWANGYRGSSPSRIMLHACKDEEVQKKSKT